MNDVLLLYLFTRLDAIQVMFVVGAVSAGICGAGIWLYAFLDGNKEVKKFSARVIAPVFAVCVTGTVFVPSSKDAAIIVGGKIALDAARSENGQEMAGAVYDAILAKLKEAANGK